MNGLPHDVLAELDRYHPLKGAIFARDWMAEARETEDPAWRKECLIEADKAISFMRAAYAL